MTKEQFLEKYDLSELDWRNLVRYEETRKSGVMNMLEYINLMQDFNVNGGKKLAQWILINDNYLDFLKTLNKKGEDTCE